jgi:membrane protease YdiL (CAAX protease family)
MSLLAEHPVLVPTRTGDSLAWMRLDAATRLLPFGLVVLLVWVAARPSWLGLGAGDLRVQLSFGVAGAAVMFAASSLGQLWITRRVRGTVKVPASAEDLVLQGGYYVVNAAAEEAFFRGLLQGGLTALAGPALGLLVATPAYVLYHRLGGWCWTDVLATAMVGVPVALAFWLLPGPPSLLGVVIIHFGATCGFLGPGPWLLRRIGLL